MKRLWVGLSAVWSLCLAVACGGSDSKDAMSTGGSGGRGGNASSASSAGSSGSGGGGKAGSSSTGGTTGNPPGGGDFSTDLPGDKPLSDLTPDEVEQLCGAIDEFYSTGSVAADIQEFGCRTSAVFVTLFASPATEEEARSACQSAYDSCQAEPSTGTDTCSDPGPGCTATVAEFEACTNDSIVYFDEAAQALPACSELTLDDLAGGGGGQEPTTPASCELLRAKCPDGPMPTGGEE